MRERIQKVQQINEDESMGMNLTLVLVLLLHQLLLDFWMMEIFLDEDGDFPG